MDIFAVLQNDHEHVLDLCRRILATRHDAVLERENLFFDLKRALEAHTKAEREIFYPRLDDIAEYRELVSNRLHEHRDLKNRLDELDNMLKGDGVWLKRFERFSKLLREHVVVEEKELFSRLKPLLSTEEAETLGSRFEARETQQLNP